MKSQIFVNYIEYSAFIDFLNLISVKQGNKYTINPIIFKQAVYNNKIEPFIDSIKNNYHLSKQKYVDKDITYKKFLTIIRQICRSLNIYYKSEIKYTNSKYSIIYYIYICNN